MTLSLDTAYRSFGGEVEASSTPTICRLPDSRRHQLSAIAQIKNIPTGAGDDIKISAVYSRGNTKDVISTSGGSPSFAMFGNKSLTHRPL